MLALVSPRAERERLTVLGVSTLPSHDEVVDELAVSGESNFAELARHYRQARSAEEVR